VREEVFFLVKLLLNIDAIAIARKPEEYATLLARALNDRDEALSVR
jgi:hypothetical protein